MNKQRQMYIPIFAGILIVVTILLLKEPQHIVYYQSELSMVNFYAYAQRLFINGTTDPPCSKIRNVYVCSGFCPWANTRNNELVSCHFLRRVSHSDFVKYNFYCTPEPDHCQTYNAWLKDNLPQTRQHIKRIPDDLLSNFTLNYSLEIHYGVQDFRTGDTWPANWTIELIEKYRSQARQRLPFGSYENKDIYPALDKYASLAIINKKCAVIGTENPWIEAALLEYNASSVTTIEYATIHSSVPRLFTITPMDFARQQQQQQNQTKDRELFDSVWSYSSLEHDGLGRYRDPLNAYGDLQTMTKITCILKPGGLLFLGVPLNTKDFVQFNLHRVYGPVRLPLLYRYFHVVEVLGTEIPRGGESFGMQPFVVLQNKVGCKNS